MVLNEQQQQVVNHVEGPLLVVSGPGSGKTTVITRRAARLLRDGIVSPDHLIVVTFSRRAADEMRHRIQRDLQDTTISITREQFTTIHSFAYQVVNRYDQRPMVLSGRGSDRLLRGILASKGLYDRRDPHTLNDLKAEISYVRSNQIDLNNPATPYASQVLDRDELWEIMRRYQQEKQAQGVSDFDDLLEDALRLVRDDPSVRGSVQDRYRYVMLDEAQDTSPLQFDLIRLVAAPQNNLAVVGDDDQSVYSFRGASPQMMLQFSKLYESTTVMKMTTNYRSTANLVRLSHRIIDHNAHRFSKDLTAVSKSKSRIRVVQPRDSEDQVGQIIRAADDQGAFARPGRMAVIYRSNIQAVALIDGLVNEGHPFRLLSSASTDVFQRPMVQDMMSFLRLADNPSEPQVRDVVQLMNKPTRYIPHRLLLEVKDRLPDVSPDVWEVLARHPNLSRRQQDAVWDFYQALIRYHRRNPDTPDLARLKDFLRQKSFNYRKHLTDQARNPEGSKIYYQQYDTFQLLAHGNDFVQRVHRIRKIMRQAIRLTDSDPGLVLTTCHSAKGLEWPHVWIIDVLEGIQPSSAMLAEGNSDEEEERRLFYVAVTRTVEDLTLSVPKKYGSSRPEVSRFIIESALLPPGDPRVKARRQQGQKSSGRPAYRVRGGRRNAGPDGGRVRQKPPGFRHPIVDRSVLVVGAQLSHIRYGEVTVRNVDDEEGVMTVETESGASRDLHIATCLKNKLIGRCT